MIVAAGSISAAGPGARTSETGGAVTTARQGGVASGSQVMVICTGPKVMVSRSFFGFMDLVERGDSSFHFYNLSSQMGAADTNGWRSEWSHGIWRWCWGTKIRTRPVQG